MNIKKTNIEDGDYVSFSQEEIDKIAYVLYMKVSDEWETKISRTLAQAAIRFNKKGFFIPNKPMWVSHDTMTLVKEIIK